MIAREDLLVVKHEEPFMPKRECIVIPRQILPGLLTALHLKLNHPSTFQLKQVFRCFFFALDADKYNAQSSRSCHQCPALKLVPHSVVNQSTCDPPEGVGLTLAADVLK